MGKLGAVLRNVPAIEFARRVARGLRKLLGSGKRS